MSHGEASAIYQSADIIVDQLRLGVIGVFTVEGMALGKPVVCFIRPDLWKISEKSLPVANADPDSIEAVLAELVRDLNLRARLGKRAREYFLKTHSSSQVVRQLESLYHLCNNTGSEIDWAAATKILDLQAQQSSGLRQLKKRSSDLEKELAKTRKHLRCSISYQARKLFKHENR